MKGRVRVLRSVRNTDSHKRAMGGPAEFCAPADCPSNHSRLSHYFKSVREIRRSTDPSLTQRPFIIRCLSSRFLNDIPPQPGQAVQPIQAGSSFGSVSGGSADVLAPTGCVAGGPRSDFKPSSLYSFRSPQSLGLGHVRQTSKIARSSDFSVAACILILGRNLRPSSRLLRALTRRNRQSR